MRTRWFAVIAALSTLHGVAAAQSVGRMLGDDFKNAGKDVLSVWGSPFDASARDWLLAGAAFAATGVSMLADEPVNDFLARNEEAAIFRAMGPVRRDGVFFKGKYVVPPIAAIYFAGLAFKNQDLRDFVMGCASAYVAQAPVRKTVYRLVGRARPTISANDAQRWSVPPDTGWDHRSFPAGHFPNVLGCVSYWSKRFHLGAAEPALYALAAAVGIGRLVDKGHWTSDTVLGGILGHAIGSEVARRSLARHAAASTAATSSLRLSPAEGGVNVSMRWTF